MKVGAWQKYRFFATHRWACFVFIALITANTFHIFYVPTTFHVPATTLPSLSFAVCNGFTNQRLSILYGMIIAKETGRSLVLPRLILNGVQYNTSATLYATAENSVKFGHFYDTHTFVQAMQRHGIQLVDSMPTRVSDKFIPEADIQAFVREFSKYMMHSHISIGCPLMRLDAALVARYAYLVRDVLSSLVPSQHFKRMLGLATRRLSSDFNFLHLRMENDWIRHCASWRSGSPGDNCFTNTYNISAHLHAKRFPTQTPLYIALDWDDSPATVATQALALISEAGYTVIKRSDLLANIKLHREEAALVEYYLAITSRRFIGNSVSTFSALLILEREQRSLWASYYNMGDIPLASFIPMYMMPWVFTYNGKSPKIDYMAKAAVLSALEKGNLTPYCIYNGTSNDSIYRWLASQGVTMISHAPTWARRVEDNIIAAKKNFRYSPLYNSAAGIFGTMQRIDVSIVSELEQFNYVLFTDVDVLFTKQVTLESFGFDRLPKAISMAVEVEPRFPCNAGVMLMNLPALRETHAALVDFTFSTVGLHFGKYGPMDQGAINSFYESAMGSKCDLSEEFNTKLYKTSPANPAIFHFHGPKPHDYLDWAYTGYCLPSFGNMCLLGFNRMCGIVHKYFPENRVVEDLKKVCHARASKLLDIKLPIDVFD